MSLATLSGSLVMRLTPRPRPHFLSLGLSRQRAHCTIVAVCLLMLQAVLGLSPVSAAPLSDEAAKKRLLSVNQAAATLVVRGSYVLQRPDGMVMAEFHQAHTPDGMVVRLETPGPAATEIIRKAGEVWSYTLPQREVSVIRHQIMRPSFPQLFLGSVDAVLATYRVTEGEGGKIAGHPTRLLKLQPKASGSRWQIRCWVHRDTKLLLKQQLLGAGGEVLEEQAFTDLHIGSDARPSVQSSLAQKGEWKTVPPMMSWQPVPATLEPQWPIAGFQLVGLLDSGLTPESRKALGVTGPVRQLFLSDGLVSLSLFLEPSAAEPAVVAHSRKGALSLAATIVPDWQVTVMGEIPESIAVDFLSRLDLGQLVRSLPPLKSLPSR